MPPHPTWTIIILLFPLPSCVTSYHRFIHSKSCQCDCHRCGTNSHCILYNRSLTKRSPPKDKRGGRGAGGGRGDQFSRRTLAYMFVDHQMYRKEFELIGKPTGTYVHVKKECTTANPHKSPPPPPSFCYRLFRSCKFVTN